MMPRSMCGRITTKNADATREVHVTQQQPYSIIAHDWYSDRGECTITRGSYAMSSHTPVMILVERSTSIVSEPKK